MTTRAKINHLFSQVSNTYQHQNKLVRPAPSLVTNDVYLKWSLIEPKSLPITPVQVDEAQQFLLRELSTGQLKLINEVGFVIQHRCAKVLILYVCTWRGDNEVWETLYHAPVQPEVCYTVTERENTSPTFCVWVLPVVLHEQRAWIRYLGSSRDRVAQEAYLNDRLTGLV